MAGESYGVRPFCITHLLLLSLMYLTQGRYLPLFASAVYDQNAALVKAGAEPINLASVMIGNGATDVVTRTLASYDYSCTALSPIGPVVDISTCVAMKHVYKRCETWMKASCVDTYDTINCGAAVGFCGSQMDSGFYATGKNPYDLTKECPGEILDSLCYPVSLYVFFCFFFFPYDLASDW